VLNGLTNIICIVAFREHHEFNCGALSTGQDQIISQTTAT